jgi:2-polyprenyl-3-methyl-5-hydroxy-6-metoxy-1,4-benzoquinol methylase
VTSNLNSTFDDDPAGYDALRDGWLFRRRLREVERHLASARAGDTVLEIGSGTGLLLRRLAPGRPDLKFLGVEPIEAYVRFANDTAGSEGVDNVTFVTGFAEDLLGLDLPTADLVLSNDVLHHVTDIDLVCKNVAGMVQDWGQWLVIEPNPQNPWVVWFHTRTEGESVFRVKRFERAAAQAGWQVLQRGHLFLVPHAMRTPPEVIARAERAFEHLPVISGGTLIRLTRANLGAST